GLTGSLHSQAMSDSQSLSGEELADVVRQVLEEARRTAGSGTRFAAGLHEIGVGGENGHYSESAISNWIKGRTMPPADVLLAAAAVARISLDAKLDQALGNPAVEDASTGELVAEVRRELGRLRADVRDLYLRLGFPAPSHLDAPALPSEAIERGA